MAGGRLISTWQSLLINLILKMHLEECKLKCIIMRWSLRYLSRTELECQRFTLFKSTARVDCGSWWICIKWQQRKCQINNSTHHCDTDMYGLETCKCKQYFKWFITVTWGALLPRLAEKWAHVAASTAFKAPGLMNQDPDGDPNRTGSKLCSI